MHHHGVRDGGGGRAAPAPNSADGSIAANELSPCASYRRQHRTSAPAPAAAPSPATANRRACRDNRGIRRGRGASTGAARTARTAYPATTARPTAELPYWASLCSGMPYASWSRTGNSRTPHRPG
nr:hypothetical protein [Actinacidiphila soli]